MIHTKIDQFLASPEDENINVNSAGDIQEAYGADMAGNPVKEPVTKPPITKPGTTPRPPGPIRRDKPTVDPRPLASQGLKSETATIKEVMARFMKALKDNETPRPFDLGKLKSKYND